MPDVELRGFVPPLDIVLKGAIANLIVARAFLRAGDLTGKSLETIERCVSSSIELLETHVPENERMKWR